MNQEMTDRQYWLNVLERIARPVLTALAEQQLKVSMPVEGAGELRDARKKYTYLEALGRTLAGVAPWLEQANVFGDEQKVRTEMAQLARRALHAGTDPTSPDFCNFSEGYQPIVDVAFLAHGILRAPNELWRKLEPTARHNIVNAMKATRSRKPHFNNWLLFAAMVETLLYKVGEDWDPMRIDYALRQHEQWYRGDGHYSDGPEFRWDYYNSFVIQPMLIDILRVASDASPEWKQFKAKVIKRAQRYAAIQERLISPEGTYPAIGRSLVYRFGAFQLLGQVALMKILPDGISAAQVRCALTTVIRRMIEAEGTFDDNGWLTIGFCGHQPGLGEEYISTGSLYLCLTGLLPLGLPPDDEFWASPPQKWTSQRMWSGQDVLPDQALDKEMNDG
jgi:hypothetical protein